jgi:7,8-dihydropterin-6-yl-methyl-4-(beta-D-ribofuranosyl)aminobenzene 5'-phosphate synthase
MIVFDRKSKMKRAFLHRILLALTIVTAVNIIYFTHSGRAQGGLAMKNEIKGVSAVTVNKLNITVVYDNNPYKKELTTSWGFACIIKGAEKTVLFDTGGDSDVLLKNMKQLGIDPKEIFCW